MTSIKPVSAVVWKGEATKYDSRPDFCQPIYNASSSKRESSPENPVIKNESASSPTISPDWLNFPTNGVDDPRTRLYPEIREHCYPYHYGVYHDDPLYGHSYYPGVSYHRSFYDDPFYGAVSYGGAYHFDSHERLYPHQNYLPQNLRIEDLPVQSVQPRIPQALQVSIPQSVQATIPQPTQQVPNAQPAMITPKQEDEGSHEHNFLPEDDEINTPGGDKKRSNKKTGMGTKRMTAESAEQLRKLENFRFPLPPDSTEAVQQRRIAAKWDAIKDDHSDAEEHLYYRPYYNLGLSLEEEAQRLDTLRESLDYGNGIVAPGYIVFPRAGDDMPFHNVKPCANLTAYNASRERREKEIEDALRKQMLEGYGQDNLRRMRHIKALRDERIRKAQNKLQAKADKATEATARRERSESPVRPSKRVKKTFQTAKMDDETYEATKAQASRLQRRARRRF